MRGVFGGRGRRDVGDGGIRLAMCCLVEEMKAAVVSCEVVVVEGVLPTCLIWRNSRSGAGCCLLELAPPWDECWAQ